MSEETIKTIVPLDFLQQARNRIAERINHPEGKDIVIKIVKWPCDAGMRIEGGKDVMSIPGNYLQTNTPYWRALIMHIMHLMMSDWYGVDAGHDEYIDNVGNYITFNSDVEFAEWGEDNADYQYLHSPENKTWHDYARSSNAEGNRARHGYMNWLLQVCRIVQQKLHLRLADGWNLSYLSMSVRGRIIQYSGAHVFRSIISGVIKYGIPTDDWKHWPVSDMLRRSEALRMIDSSCVDITDIIPEYRRYLNDPEYKKECLMELEQSLDLYLFHGNIWTHGLPPTQTVDYDPYIEEGSTDNTTIPDPMNNNTPEAPSDDSTSSAGSPFPTLE